MNHLTRIQQHLPGPYALAVDAVLSRVLDVIALELEAFQEDVDRMRQAHWIRFAFRLNDAEKLGALVGVARLPWETLKLYRSRLLPLVKARLAGALGPREIRRFAYDYIRGAEDALSDPGAGLAYQFVPGLRRVDADQAFGPVPERPLFRPLELRENPQRLKTSGALAVRSGRVPYLFRWEERNKGLDETVARFRISGLFGGRTTVPVLVNRTTGDLLGYAGRLPFGQTLVIDPRPEDGTLGRAMLNGADVTSRLFSVAGVVLGHPFTRTDMDEAARLPRMVRGANQWMFLSIGLYDINGLSRFFFALAGEDLREGVYDQTFFDRSLFPSGPVARLEMDWIETEPACFEVRVPGGMVIEPTAVAAAGEIRPCEQIAGGLADAVRALHAAGVKSAVRFIPFEEIQPQRVRVTLPWMKMPPEKASPGTGDEVFLGGRFGETSLGGSRFE